MKIAILGWGSLIWCPRELNFDLRWRKAGPKLPIEFARKSCDGRLTLVIYPTAKKVKTYWTLSTESTLKAAKEDLRKREGTSPKKIGFVSLQDVKQRCQFDESITRPIQTWAKGKKVDAVIWTDLESNFKDKCDKDFSEEAAIKYLKCLTGDRESKAKEYIVRAPEQTDTSLRRRIKKELGWSADK